jgi:hypothetical protein
MLFWIIANGLADSASVGCSCFQVIYNFVYRQAAEGKLVEDVPVGGRNLSSKAILKRNSSFNEFLAVLFAGR